jgi:hypothetical protein
VQVNTSQQNIYFAIILTADVNFHQFCNKTQCYLAGEAQNFNYGQGQEILLKDDFIEMSIFSHMNDGK